MRPSALLAACILVIPAYTTAQTTAADGVLALIQDDPSAAVRILSPLVEGRAEPDPLAAFFLALAYQSGGRGSYSMRSCGLLMKAATPSNPLMRQAELLAKQLHMNHWLARNNCEIAATRGWGEPAWTTFTLSPRHQVRIDRSGFSVDYEGTSKLTPEGWGGAGWQFLPIRLTEMDLSTHGQGPRYFLELFVWTPHTAADAPQWSLAWFAYEVVGADVIRLLPGEGRVASAVGPSPPMSFPVGDVARFVAADNGEVERIVIGEEARRVTIPARSVR
jgi:hypothetical protein